ncbi:MAG: hypothetical protein A3F74_10650 [Betaproteobacteria bacterium RIFCSPLOWO2_12_FULL_62_58]|nr:MAG: hypothetical protein A3F74_10650 [Betaproteobacteria bacterium RIFCSPLOWO2_12_FULL_62_58]
MPIPDQRTQKSDLMTLLREKGEVSPTQAYEALAKKWRLTEREKKQKRSGDFLFQHEIRWARQDLVIEGIIERPHTAGRGNWRLKAGGYRAPNDHGDEVTRESVFVEGATTQVLVNRFERNVQAREKCLEVHGYVCKACGIDFEKTYGGIGKHCMHVHHVVPIGSVRKEYQLSPEKDLVPLCPNCHYMIHRREPPFTVAEIRAMIRANRLLNADAWKSSARRLARRKGN